MKTAFQRPKAGSYETGDKMSLTHHKQISKIRPRLDVRSETPFQFCLSHAVMRISGRKKSNEFRNIATGCRKAIVTQMDFC